MRKAWQLSIPLLQQNSCSNALQNCIKEKPWSNQVLLCAHTTPLVHISRASWEAFSGYHSMNTVTLRNFCLALNRINKCGCEDNMNRKTRELIIVKARVKWDRMEWANGEAEQRKILEKCKSYLVEQGLENLRTFAKQCSFLGDIKYLKPAKICHPGLTKNKQTKSNNISNYFIF